MSSIPDGGLGEIATDGATLFWIDYGSVRSLPINGGTVTTLVQGTGRILGGVYVTHISLAPDFVYYISNLGISHIPKSGGPVDQVYPAYSAAALYVWSPTPSYSAVFWGDSEGVHSVDPEGMLYTWPQNGPLGSVTSIGYDGYRALWIGCFDYPASQCTLSIQDGGIEPTVIHIGATAGDLQWDSTSAYWINAAGIWRYVY